MCPWVRFACLLAVASMACSGVWASDVEVPLKKRELPKDRSFEKLFYADTEHRYFENLDRISFSDKVNEMDLFMAWHFAELSMISYVDDIQFLKTTLKRAGYDEMALLKNASTVALCVASPERIVICFRGTEPGDISDLATDLKFVLTDFNRRGKVHSGFLSAYENIEPAIETWLSDLNSEEGIVRPIFATGHSLGGALAVLFGASRDELSSSYVFGCPRVGNSDFSDSLVERKNYRFENNNDIVPHLPPSLVYRHSGDLFYFPSDGALIRTPSFGKRLGHDLIGHRNFLKELGVGWLDGRLDNVPSDYLVDHAPIFYATKLWNAGVETEIGKVKSTPWIKMFLPSKERRKRRE